MKASTRPRSSIAVVATLVVEAVCVAALAGCADSLTRGSSSDAGTAVNECASSTGVTIEHAGFVTRDETWEAGLHRVTGRTEVRTGVTLTIAPCAVVRLDENASIIVNDDAGGLAARRAWRRSLPRATARKTWPCWHASLVRRAEEPLAQLT